ncbi:MAG: hypothetical protein RBU45_14265 [Myxococcota bacterium]|jgi:hypothetical protein|nr:hypothetical protein [Myxococcota bacterium]
MTRSPPLLLLFSLVTLPLPAWALLGDGDGPLGVDGSLRTVTAAAVYDDVHPLLTGPDNRADGFSQSLLRLVVSGRPRPWLSYEVHGVQSLDLVTRAGAAGSGGLATGTFVLPGSGGGDTPGPYRALDASWRWSGDEPDVIANLWLDRAAVKLAWPWFDLTVGRQPIHFGKAYFWNPLDAFLPFDARQFDRDYKAGVDALRLDVPLGDFSGLNVVAVAGRTLDAGGATGGGTLDASWEGSALILRAYTTWQGFDLAVQGGKVEGGGLVGGAFAGEVPLPGDLGALELRGEGAWLVADSPTSLPSPLVGPVRRDHAKLVLGVGRRFASSLTVAAEYLHDGLGEPEQLAAGFWRVARGAALQVSQDVLGVTASYEILPILVGSLGGLQSLTDGSTLLLPGLTLSLSDEAELVLGAMLSHGARPLDPTEGSPLGLHSEFGSYPHVGYGEFKVYF